MLKALITAFALLCLSGVAQAAPCVETGTVMRPSCMGGNFLAGVRSIRVVMHRMRHVSTRPIGCPHAWCGCFLASYLGLHDRSLWQARRWAGIGSAANGPQVGAIAVWHHHVGLIRAVDGNRILLLSGNDGHAVRERWRTTSGIIAYRIAG
jgi:hypothetical protein